MADGFLGTRASIMLDVVVIALLLVVPALLYSLYIVRYKNDYTQHKWIQIVMSIVLFIVVGLFEIDMQMQGGFWAMAENTPTDRDFMNRLLSVHLVFSISTFFLWLITFVTAWKKFPSPPAPGAFSKFHRRIAWVTVIDMVLTVVTGYMVYYFGFWVQ